MWALPTLWGSIPRARPCAWGRGRPSPHAACSLRAGVLHSDVHASPKWEDGVPPVPEIPGRHSMSLLSLLNLGGLCIFDIVCNPVRSGIGYPSAQRQSLLFTWKQPQLVGTLRGDGKESTWPGCPLEHLSRSEGCTRVGRPQTGCAPVGPVASSILATESRTGRTPPSQQRK